MSIAALSSSMLFSQTKARPRQPQPMRLLSRIYFKSRSSLSPNPSVKRTHNGVARPALISFWAKHAPPLRAAYLER